MFAQRLTLGTTGVATPVQVGIAMNNYAAAAENQNITTFIENGEAAGTSLYAIRHNNYNGTGGYYDMFAYRMTGANSDLTIGAPIAVNFAVGGVHRMKVNSLVK